MIKVFIQIQRNLHLVCSRCQLARIDAGAFYGHGWGFFGAQVLGIACIDVWAIAAGIVLFYGIKKLVGLRVDKRIEEEGLDIYEHGESCYN